MKIYLAGSLFNEAEIKQRKWEGQRMREAFPEADVCNPIDQPFNENKESLPAPQTIYNSDIKSIRSCDVFVADLTNEDPGVMLALGIAIEAKVPHVIGVNSDSRMTCANQYDIPSYGMNHFVLGAVLENGILVSSFEKAVIKIKEIMNKK
ncbi:nucleoside 2-deoxyribosyltransferase [Copranaerobaculum intestinale]|nr:nucleoside 2-deoxyribosyltransferase [Copranaerobaculum intestinale]